MTEILDLANSIAASKEEIRQAIVARGVDCGQNVPLADYADKINNMVVSGSVDNVLATNYTGAAVTAGDKVFIKQNVAIEGSRAQVYTSNASSSSYFYLLNPAGTKVYYGTHVYDVASGTTDSTSFSWNQYNPIIHYDNSGNMFQGAYVLGESPLYKGMIFTQDDYAHTVFDNGYFASFSLYKVDKTDFSITQTWTVNLTSNKSNLVVCIIGNKIYATPMYVASSSLGEIGTIDENSNTITMVSRVEDGLVPAYSTSDNKLAICAYKSGNGYAIDGSSNLWEQIILVSLTDTYELGDIFVSANNDLTNLQGLTGNFVIFNRNTGVLCIGNVTSNDYYGVFKYNTTTHDFDTVALVLTDYATTGYKIITVTTDLSKIQLNNYLYTLDQPSGGYRALTYQPDMGSDVLTGVALDSAEVGNTFNVKTILP